MFVLFGANGQKASEGERVRKITGVQNGDALCLCVGFVAPGYTDCAEYTQQDKGRRAQFDQQTMPANAESFVI